MSPQPDVAAVGESTQTDLGWRIVGLTNLYRLLAVVVLLSVHLLTQPAPAFGSNLPRLFGGVLVVYFVIAVLLAFVGRRYWPGRRALVLTHALVDAGAIALLMYASGGVSSNLGVLLVIPVGSMALLAVGREALVIAAIASLAILAQQIASQLSGFCGTGDYLLAGVMGVIVFLVAASAWPVANRLRESEAQVRRQEVDLANLAQLSQYIVQRLRESILVVDPSDRIRLINESAAEMLGDAAAVPGALLGEVSPRLLYLLTTWRTSAELRPGESPQGTFSAADGARIVEAHFAPLGAAEPAPMLIFLEDTSALAARVQQSKLAALGRLTASIAHEIRNPVGAMSHAAQLLGESSQPRARGPAPDRDHAQQRTARQRDRRERAATFAPRSAASGRALRCPNGARASARNSAPRRSAIRRASSCRCQLARPRNDHRCQPAAPDPVEPVRERLAARRLRRQRAGRRAAAGARRPLRARLPRGRRSRPGSGAAGRGAHLRTFLHARCAGHRPRIVPGA
jgi:signal transduction histidine kinase